MSEDKLLFFKKKKQVFIEPVCVQSPLWDGQKCAYLWLLDKGGGVNVDRHI